jgi:hypothetical protein
MRTTHRGGKYGRLAGVVLILGLGSQLSAQVDLSRLSPQQVEMARQTMTTTLCTCGCELTVAACLIDDPSCDVSPAMAQAIVEEILAAPGSVPDVAPAAIDRRGGGAGPVSDQGEWYQRLVGQQLVYISLGTGYRTREQTYLCTDGTFLTNQESGSVTSLGTAAMGGNSAGRWAVAGDRITLAYGSGETVGYTLSMVDGTLYLDDWRYFWTDNDRCP